MARGGGGHLFEESGCVTKDKRYTAMITICKLQFAACYFVFRSRLYETNNSLHTNIFVHE